MIHMAMEEPLLLLIFFVLVTVLVLSGEIPERFQVFPQYMMDRTPVIGLWIFCVYD